MQFPQPQTYLPELITFLERLAEAIDRGEADWAVLSAQVQQFFTPAMMNQIESVIPGWREMASHSNGLTQAHVVAVFVNLLLAPEYPKITEEQQIILQWAVLFHDATKVMRNGRGDTTHAFRSAALAGTQLPKLGFALNAGTEADLAAWAELTATAIRMDDERTQPIQGNGKLPEILEGIHRLYGTDSPAALIIKVVLFHMSITVSAMWPQTAPLTDAEVGAYIDDTLLPVLMVMMIVDGLAWDFYLGDANKPGRSEALITFEKIAEIVHTAQPNRQ